MMPKLILYSLCILILTFSGLCIPVVAPTVLAASVEYVPLAPIDVRGSEFTSSTYNEELSTCVAPTCFPRYLRTIYNVGIALAGFFVVFSIVRGGFTLLFTDSILGHSEGKAIILRALGGAVIVYGSYILMNQISPSLGRDLDLSLAFERVPKALTGRGLTVVNQTPEGAYSAFLDDALKRVNSIDQKAEAIQDQWKALEKRIADGDYESPSEKTNMEQSIAKLKVAETEMRSYQGAVDYLSTNMRTQIRQCAQGQGACSVPKGDLAALNPANWNWSWGIPYELDKNSLTTANTNQAENNHTVNLMVNAAEGKVRADAQKLRASGLVKEAEDLENRVQNIKEEAEFYKRCSKTTTSYARGKDYLNPNTPCPP